VPSTIKELANRRRLQRITRRQMQRRLNCSYSWLKQLEDGLYLGPCVPKWRDRYEAELDAAIEDRKVRNGNEATS
jgi:CRISPR/Cas system Type II protein with McrA/HNH and RuvC-like nuclease domain